MVGPSNCPKCGYRRGAEDDQVMSGICPNCGIAIAKYLARQRENEQQQSQQTVEDTTTTAPDRVDQGVVELDDVDIKVPLKQRLWATVTYVPHKVDSVSFWGRAITYGVFFIWGWSFVFHGIDWEYIGGSFLHNVILPFHEFGHVLFAPLGRFMGILGGSLFQVLMPLGIMFAFIFQRQDNYAASLMLWWCGQSFIDLSPYIADAPHRNLPLIMGMGEDAHDWGNLLTMMNSLDVAKSLANTSFFIGTLLFIVSYVWGGYILHLQWRVIERF